MRATTPPSSSSPSHLSSSASLPIAVRVAASSSRVASVVTCWRSQFSLNFIASGPGVVAPPKRGEPLLLPHLQGRVVIAPSPCKGKAGVGTGLNCANPKPIPTLTLPLKGRELVRRRSEEQTSEIQTLTGISYA